MKKLTIQQAKEKIFRYCAYQERSHLEVRNKLYELGVNRDEIDELITQLITENYLNEERFARAFAGGKFRLKKWGKIKITLALEAKGVSRNCIKLGLSEITQEGYLSTLENILQEKNNITEEENLFVRKDRLSKYAIQKGFEPELVWKVLNEIFQERPQR